MPLSSISYNRENAVAYALRWALQSNPQYYDYSDLGGDCTNFASQVIFAGAGVMNFTPVYGWYYRNPNDKTPSWTGVNFLYQFLIGNRSKGPYAAEIALEQLELGDIIQMSFIGNNQFQHSLPVTRIVQPIKPENIYVSTHSPKALNEKLSTYSWVQIRFLRINGVFP